MSLQSVICRDHPPNSHVATLHSIPPCNTWHDNSSRVPPRGAHGTLKSSTRTMLSLVRIYCPDPGNLGRKTRVILSHFRQPVTARILPPVEQKDRNDGKLPPMTSDSRLQNDDDSTTASVPS